MDEINKFQKSEYDANSFCTKYEFSYYKNNSNNVVDFKPPAYLRCGMISFKRKLPVELWNYILHQIHTFSDKKFVKLLDGLHNYHKEIMPNKTQIKNYKEFEYGMDEIILNYYIKTYMEYHYKKQGNNTINKREIVKKILQNLLGEGYTGDIKKDLNSFNQLFFTNIQYQSTYNEINKYMVLLRNPEQMKLLGELGLPNTIKRFLINFDRDNINSVLSFDNYFYSYNMPSYF